MLRYWLRSLFVLLVAASLGACDFGRSDLTEAPPEEENPPSTDPPAEENVCAALIDGEPFEAEEASASVALDGTLAFECEREDVSLFFQIQPADFGPDTLALGVPGGRAQYRVGDNVTVTVDLPGGEEVGELELETFTRDHVRGTFWFTVPGFQEGAPLIRVTEGAFDIAVN